MREASHAAQALASDEACHEVGGGDVALHDDVGVARARHLGRARDGGARVRRVDQPAA